MNFGRIDLTELNNIDLSLPPDAQDNKTVLSGIPATNLKIYLGNPIWGSNHWPGKLYPSNTKEKQYATFYPQHFNSIELNATHYRIYERDFVLKWKEKAAGHDFIFCPKMYNGITHEGNLKDKASLVQLFLESISHLQPYLGPVFIQLSESFNASRKQELYAFLKSLPNHQQFFLEMRHPDWFNILSVRKELFELLKEWGIGAVITDTAGRRDVAHMELPIPATFIRYVGNNLHPTDCVRIDDWIKRIQYWLDNGLQELYFFLHMHEEMFNPELAVYMAEKLNKTCGLNLPVPKLRNDPTPTQGNMFD